MKVIIPILILNFLILSPFFFINAQTPEIKQGLNLNKTNSQSEILKLIELKLQSLAREIAKLQKEISLFIMKREIAELREKAFQLKERIEEIFLAPIKPEPKKEKEGKEGVKEKVATTTEEVATTTEEIATTTEATTTPATTTEATTTEATTTEEEVPVTGGGGGGFIPPPPPADTTPPAAITDLTCSNPTFTSIDLSWTAPGDDGNSGTAASYDIRYSTEPISEQNWDLAIQITGEPTPAQAGSSQSMTVSGLVSGTTYYFAIKTSDEASNISGLSNIASLSTKTQEKCSVPLASGKQTYFVTTKVQPQIMQIDIDPLDVKIGETQTITAKIRDTNGNPITSVTGTAKTDNGSFSFSLSLVEGTDLNGTWQGTWILEDTNCNTYMITITAESASGQSKVDLAFR